jgi:hypothetical protein
MKNDLTIITIHRSIGSNNSELPDPKPLIEKRRIMYPHALWIPRLRSNLADLHRLGAVCKAIADGRARTYHIDDWEFVKNFGEIDFQLFNRILIAADKKTILIDGRGNKVWLRDPLSNEGWKRIVAFATAEKLFRRRRTVAMRRGYEHSLLLEIRAVDIYEKIISLVAQLSIAEHKRSEQSRSRVKDSTVYGEKLWEDFQKRIPNDQRIENYA